MRGRGNRLREVRSLGQSHTASEEQSQAPYRPGSSPSPVQRCPGPWEITRACHWESEDLYSGPISDTASPCASARGFPSPRQRGMPVRLRVAESVNLGGRALNHLSLRVLISKMETTTALRVVRVK